VSKYIGKAFKLVQEGFFLWSGLLFVFQMMGLGLDHLASLHLVVAPLLVSQLLSSISPLGPTSPLLPLLWKLLQLLTSWYFWWSSI
jgi:hypothetical protein